MSGARGEAIAAYDAQEIQAQAAHWILRRQDSPDWSEQDQADIENWAAQSVVHRVTYLRLEAAWNNAIRLNALNLGAAEPTGRVASKRWFKVGAAAVAGVAMLAGAVASYVLLPREQSYVTPVGGHQIVVLADGSEIELNTDTVLRVMTRMDQQTAWLDKGEAYFRIHHNAAHPFVVMAAGHRVIDIGTEFLVRRDSDRFEVALVKGRAKLESASASAPFQPIMLKPGDVVVANSATKTMKEKVAQNLGDELGWRRGLLNFRNATLKDVAEEFNRYNNEKLILAGDDVEGLKINGTFGARNIGLFVESAKQIFGLRATKINSEIVISR